MGYWKSISGSRHCCRLILCTSIFWHKTSRIHINVQCSCGDGERVRLVKKSGNLIDSFPAHPPDSSTVPVFPKFPISPIGMFSVGCDTTILQGLWILKGYYCRTEFWVSVRDPPSCLKSECGSVSVIMQNRLAWRVQLALSSWFYFCPLPFLLTRNKSDTSIRLYIFIRQNEISTLK